MNRQASAAILEVPRLAPTPWSNHWTSAEVSAEMDRILASPLFIKSVRLSRFLRTAVEYLLEGRAESFKEYTVGTEVYDRRSGYDPTHDTIVRTEARRLRTKLHEFYSRFPSSDHVRIGFNAGSYVPVIHRQPRRFATGLDATDQSPIKRGDIRIAVSSIHAWADDSAAQYCASDMTDDLILSLTRQPGLTVFRSSQHRTDDGGAQLQMWKRSRVDAVIHGTVRGVAETLSASMHLATLSGRVLWARKFDSIQQGNGFAIVCEEIVSEILTRVATGLPDEVGVLNCGIVQFAATPSLVRPNADGFHYGG